MKASDNSANPYISLGGVIAAGLDGISRRLELSESQLMLVDPATLSKMWVLRRILMQMGTIDAMQFLLDKMKDAKSNEDFFASMNQ